MFCFTQARGRTEKKTHNSFRVPKQGVVAFPYDNIGAMKYECIYCKALLYRDEISAPGTVAHPSSGMCCGHGQVKLAAHSDAPPLLKDLLEGRHPKSTQFLKYIRAYNSALSMASSMLTDETLYGVWSV